MSFNVKHEALVFRIWQVLNAENFRCSQAYAAEQVGVSESAVSKICRAKGWITSGGADDNREALANRRTGIFTPIIPVDQLMLDYGDYSRLECFSSEES